MAYETNPLLALWYALPPNVRQQYTSGLKAAGELSSGAAVRDVVDASGQVGGGLLNLKPWEVAGGLVNMATAAAGVVPGGKLVVKGAQKVADEVIDAGGKVIKAYHGSPHSFEKFDTAKIGTGEGAQAYGHGLYFAENEDVARSYKRAGPANNAQMDAINGELSRISRELDQYRHGSEYGKYTDPKGYELKAQYDALMQKKMDLGHMYEVNINADPVKMLDWDRPLGQQSEAVKSLDDLYWRQYAKKYPDITAFLKSPEGSKAAQELGIPGIRYLDEGSRNKLDLLPKNPITDNAREMLAATNNDAAAAIARLREMSKDFGSRERAEIEKVIRQSSQQGTSNYVVFDPALIEILRKYGLLPVAAGGAAAATVPSLLAPPDDKGAY